MNRESEERDKDLFHLMKKRLSLRRVFLRNLPDQ